jgi:perosamine synthetase
MKRPIAPSLSPNTELDDMLLAIKILFQPWKWKKGSALGHVNQILQKFFPEGQIYLFNSARSSLYLLLQAFNIGMNDEVIIQAFTCVAVPDPVLWVGATPVYADIDRTGNIDVGLLEKSITKKTKAIIVQHTFGVPADVQAIKKIVQKYDLVLIEDCAHAFGSSSKEQKIGSFGDATIVSFGRDKVISSVFGGAAILNTNDGEIKNRMETLYKNIDLPGYYWIFQQIFHPIIFLFVLPLYQSGIGKIFLEGAKRLRLLSLPINNIEKTGERPEVFPLRYPNALAELLQNQLEKLERYNKRRVQIAHIYNKELSGKKDIILPSMIEGSIYLRYNIRSQQADQLFKKAKQRGILLGNWYHCVIDPSGVDFIKVAYTPGSCPKAEQFASTSVNLPTYPTMTDVDITNVLSLFSD